MTFLELCNARYSCRAYRPDAVPADKLDYVLTCARLAPSACNRQPWRLRIVTDAARLGELHACYDREWFSTAPAVIVVSVRHDEAWVRKGDGKDHADIDASIITEHICLAAAEQGLGTCWVCNFDAPRVHTLLGLDAAEEAIALIPIGLPADTAPAKRRKATEEFVIR